MTDDVDPAHPDWRPIRSPRELRRIERRFKPLLLRRPALALVASYLLLVGIVLFLVPPLAHP